MSSETEAINLVKQARELCSTGKLLLHKKVIASVPQEDCANAVKDLDMALGEV